MNINTHTHTEAHLVKAPACTSSHVFTDTVCTQFPDSHRHTHRNRTATSVLNHTTQMHSFPLAFLHYRWTSSQPALSICSPPLFFALCLPPSLHPSITVCLWAAVSLTAHSLLSTSCHDASLLSSAPVLSYNSPLSLLTPFPSKLPIPPPPLPRPPLHPALVSFHSLLSPPTSLSPPLSAHHRSG